MDKEENIIPNKRRRITPSVSTKPTCSGSENSTNVVNIVNTDRPVLNIVDLCDDCLFEIFDNLDLFDWSSMAGTCKRFKQIASILFIKKFEYFDVGKVKCHSPSLVINDSISLEVFNGILREFGPLIKGFSAQIVQGEDKNCAEKAIVKYCGKSRSLDLNRLEIDAESFATLDPFLNTLCSLYLANCKLSPSAVLTQYPNNIFLEIEGMEISNANFFNQCNQMEQLKFFNVKLNVEIWNQHFPKLISFSLIYLSVQVEEITIFFRKNPQLKHIFIYDCENLDESTLVSIGKYLPDVTLLSWCSNKIDPPIDFWQMPKLSQLSSLNLHCKGFETSLLLDTLISENNFLKRLEFKECILNNEFEKSVIKLRHLKDLTLSDCSELSIEKMDNLFAQLRHLDRFSLSMYEYTIRDIHQLLRSIPPLKELTVKIRHEDTIQIDEYKMWMTEIHQRVDYCVLRINVTATHNYRWLEDGLKMFERKNKLRMFISVNSCRI